MISGGGTKATDTNLSAGNWSASQENELQTRGTRTVGLFDEVGDGTSRAGYGVSLSQKIRDWHQNWQDYE